MYGLIGKMKAQSGKRDELASLMESGMPEMSGCVSYVIAACNNDADGIWITEVWHSKEAQLASLSTPAVGELISKARPLIVGFEHGVETTPISGIGISS